MLNEAIASPVPSHRAMPSGGQICSSHKNNIINLISYRNEGGFDAHPGRNKRRQQWGMRCHKNTAYFWGLLNILYFQVFMVEQENAFSATKRLRFFRGATRGLAPPFQMKLRNPFKFVYKTDRSEGCCAIARRNEMV
jgi:hypothetical protein